MNIINITAVTLSQNDRSMQPNTILANGMFYI